MDLEMFLDSPSNPGLGDLDAFLDDCLKETNELRVLSKGDLDAFLDDCLKETNELRVEVLSKDAKMPERLSEHAPGLILYSAVHGIIPPGRRAKFSTGLSMEIPQGKYGRLCDVDCNYLDKGLHVIGGIMESNFEQEVVVCLVNLTKVDQIVNIGEPVAQLICQEYSVVTPKRVKRKFECLENE